MIKEENVKQRMVRFRKKHKKQEDSVLSKLLLHDILHSLTYFK